MANATHEVIRSASNPKVREYRECVTKGIPDTVALEGVRLVGDALAVGVGIYGLFVTQTAAAAAETAVAAAVADAAAAADPGIRAILAAARGADVPVHVVSDRVGHSMGSTVNPQGLFALARWSPGTGRGVLEQVEKSAQGPSFVVLLDGVQDPGNVGAIVRTAAALGASAVIAGAGSADLANPKVIRASMGAAFRIPVGREANLSRLMAWAAGRGWAGFASHVDPAGSTRVDELRWPAAPDETPQGGGLPARAMVVIGSEAHGVSHDCLEQCAGTVHVPMAREVESLNAATAAAIVIYELGRNISRIRG